MEGSFKGVGGDSDTAELGSKPRAEKSATAGVGRYVLKLNQVLVLTNTRADIELGCQYISAKQAGYTSGSVSRVGLTDAYCNL